MFILRLSSQTRGRLILGSLFLLSSTQQKHPDPPPPKHLRSWTKLYNIASVSGGFDEVRGAKENKGVSGTQDVYSALGQREAIYAKQTTALDQQQPIQSCQRAVTTPVFPRAVKICTFCVRFANRQLQRKNDPLCHAG